MNLILNFSQSRSSGCLEPTQKSRRRTFERWHVPVIRHVGETLINSARILRVLSPMKPKPSPSKQQGFASFEFEQKKRATQREKFLGEMEQVVPWTRLESVVEAKHPTAGRIGRQPIGVPSMLRMYFLQQWFGLADGRWRTPSTTASRCATSWASIWDVRRCLTSPRS